MENKTIVLSSSRAIRHAQLSTPQETLFLPHYITMSDFISKLCVVEGYKFIDSDTRILLLLQASDFKNFTKLQIERNFFTFTKNSSYILSFFQELSSELSEIEILHSADTYAEYEEHITILQELYNRYETLCNEHKLLDTIFLPKLYKLNSAYLQLHPEIDLYVDGYLTAFELKIIEEATAFSRINLHFTAGKFNTKMQRKFEELGFCIKKGYKYILDFQAKKILLEEPYHSQTKIACESVSENLLQVAFVKKKIYEYISKGYDPQKIAVVVPNENAVKMLKHFDTKANLNFAMGESFTQTHFYKELQATITFLAQQTQENKHRLERVGERLYALIQPHYFSSVESFDVVALLEKIGECCEEKVVCRIYEKELHHFKKLLPFLQEMPLKSLLNLFMQRLAKQSIDDIRGGKVTVMGVLETRGIAFDGVIIIDFDDDNVPRRSQKDMFLNTQVRKHANLPTPNDRENLQRHYYEMLINASREVAIAYVESPTKKASTFLKQLGIVKENIYDESDYAQLLFTKHLFRGKKDEEIVQPYSFKHTILSATQLKTYLTCKRKYYYEYVAKIQEFNIPKDIPKEHEIGSKVHAALKELYTQRNFYNDAKELQRDLWKYLDMYEGKSELDKYLMGLQKKYLEPFCEYEVKRFAKGWRVEECEISAKTFHNGLMLQGKIDRIDSFEDTLAVIDYKTGKYTTYTPKTVSEATDFQLEFYYLLAKKEGKELTCSFYDLQNIALISEPLLEEKLALLDAHIADLLQVEEIEFSMCEETKNCRYCPYATMCGR